MSTTRIHPAVFTASTTSAVVDLGEGALVGLELPSGFAGTTCSFQGSNDGVTFQDVWYVSATQVAAILTLTTLAASKNYTLSPDLLAGFRYLKLVAGSGTYTVNCIARSLWG